ncbi:MAG: hypothetical protein J6X44_10820, partial [Thermoguttaceae bacterium]|nr:hypothetical protein [Thermoguttaceae bacterium]
MRVRQFRSRGGARRLRRLVLTRSATGRSTHEQSEFTMEFLEGKTVGIDLGTTFSTLAIVNEQ